MSAPPERTATSRPWWHWGALVVVLLLGLGAWALWGGRSGTGDGPGQGAAEAGTVSDAGGGEAVASVSHVLGQVFVERPREPGPVEPAPVEVEASTGPVEPEPVEPEPVEPEPVDLEPPPAGDCTVLAWQQGTRVSEPVACEADGSFDAALHPGVHGRTAFEILVPGHLRAVLEVDVPEGGTGRLPAVALGPARRVEGQVVDGRGEPVAGIVLEAMPQPNLQEPEPWRATSDAEGRFVLDTLPAGPVTVRAVAPGFAPSVVEAIVPQSDLLVTLQALVDLRGRVIGSPDAVARARVRIEGSGVWPVREQMVQADGSFVLPSIPDGVYALEAVVQAGEPGEVELASIPLENVTPELAITLALVPAHRVPVEVRDPEGEPVAGARVVLSNSSVGLLPRIAVTDELGHVDIGPVVPGPYVLRADADGLLPSTPVALSMDGPDMELQVLVLARPGRISGRVVDEDGRPVDGARVELRAEHLFSLGEGQVRARFAQASLQAAGSLGVTTGPVPEVPLDGETPEDSGSSVLTDAEGGFAFEMLTPGEYVVEASHGRYARSEQERVRLGAAGVRGGVQLVLRTGQRLTGRVLDGNDRPVEGARVSFDDGRQAWSDGRGVFDGGFRRGRQHLRASAPGLAPRALEVVVRDEPVDVEIVLLRARGRLSGRVAGGNGEALANARVTLRTVDGLSATRIEWTDERGLYRFEDLPAGVVEIEIDHPDHAPTQQRVHLREEDADETVDMELVAGWEIEVDVRLEGSRDAVAGARVEGGGARGYTDDSGVAVLRNLVDERVRLEVSAQGYGRRSLWVERDGAPKQSRRVELSAGGGLRGRVTDYRGDPVAGVQVVVRDMGGQPLGSARTDAKGEWAVEGVAAGDVEVTVEPPAMREEELAGDRVVTDVLRGRDTKGVDLRLDRR